jgi:hypothetical protein
MKSEYTIRIKTPGGMITEVKIVADSYGIASSMAATYGQVLGLLESRYI